MRFFKPQFFIQKKSSAPFLHSGSNSNSIMRMVLFSLLPWASVRLWGAPLSAFVSLGVSLLVAGVYDLWIQRQSALPRTIQGFVKALDWSNFITAVLLWLTLPLLFPWWALALSLAFSLWVVKYLYGGLGYNLFNPAIAGYVFASLVFTVSLSNALNVDAYSGATWLLQGESSLFSVDIQSFWPWLAALLVSWAMLRTFEYATQSLVLGRSLMLFYALGFVGIIILSYCIKPQGQFFDYLAYHGLSASFLLALVFYITDPVTAPGSFLGRILYALLAGVLGAAIRLYTPLVDGIAYGILLANLTVPLWDQLTYAKRIRA